MLGGSSSNSRFPAPRWDYCTGFSSGGDRFLNRVNNDISQLPELRNRIRGYVDSIISYTFPASEAESYLEATAKAPDLVRNETDPIQFVRFCKYNIYEGSKQLCLYWKERLKHFGEERAFLPLVLTGTGALSNEDLLFLHSGFPALLPETRSGRKCLLIDRRKDIPGMAIEHFFRCLFYVFRLMAEDDGTQLDCALCLMAMITPRQNNFDMCWIEAVFSLIGRVFPVRLQVHLLNAPQHGMTTFAKNAYNVEAKEKIESFGMETLVHLRRNAEEMRQELLLLNLSRDGIPLAFGGEWKVEEFFKWCQRRKEWEFDMYKNRLMKEFPSNKRKKNRDSDEERKQQQQDNDIVSDEEEGSRKPRAYELTVSERRRYADMLHSRRKRERRSRDARHLKEQYSNLVVENHRLKIEQDQLQNLLERTTQILTSISDDSGPGT